MILGGGTAGWLTAFLLRKSLGTDVKITLIESKKNPIIGVGEATVPTIRFSMKYLGFDEADWMPKCQASYKLGVKFDNWLNKGHSYYHPFHHNKQFSSLTNPFYKLPDLPGNFDLLQYFASIPLADRDSDFARFSSVIPDLCDHLKSPRFVDRSTKTASYAYHFDTHLLNKYFYDNSAERNIQYIEDSLQKVNLNDSGFISSLTFDSGQTIHGELFIDCSGFKSLLIEGAMKEPFISGKKYLLCDTAIAMQLPYEDKTNELQPYTSAIAQSAGWIWKTPLQHRIGTGYVYASDFISEDCAVDELFSQYPGRTDGFSPRSIKMKVGRYQRTWVKNCVALGLAGSFIEPLESTSIGLTEYQIHSLIQLFPDKSFPQHLQDRFNEKINYCYDQLRDFIVLHYCLTQRDDNNFWKTVSQKDMIPDSLKYFLKNLKSWIAHPKPEADWAFFQRFNFGCILSGMGSLPHTPLPILNYLDNSEIRNQIEKLSLDKLKLTSTLPTLADYLAQMRHTDIDLLSKF